MWHQIACDIGAPVVELKERMPVTEFQRWRLYYNNLDYEKRHRDDWHWAALIFEVWKLPYRVWGKEPPNDITLNRFLLNFDKTPQANPTQDIPSDDKTDKVKLPDPEALKHAMIAAFSGFGTYTPGPGES